MGAGPPGPGRRVGGGGSPAWQCRAVSDPPSPPCRLRLLRELVQQPVPDPENRGAQQGSTRVGGCACARVGVGVRACVWAPGGQRSPSLRLVFRSQGVGRGPATACSDLLVASSPGSGPRPGSLLGAPVGRAQRGLNRAAVLRGSGLDGSEDQPHARGPGRGASGPWGGSCHPPPFPLAQDTPTSRHACVGCGRAQEWRPEPPGPALRGNGLRFQPCSFPCSARAPATPPTGGAGAWRAPSPQTWPWALQLHPPPPTLLLVPATGGLAAPLGLCGSMAWSLGRSRDWGKGQDPPRLRLSHS